MSIQPGQLRPAGCKCAGQASVLPRAPSPSCMLKPRRKPAESPIAPPLRTGPFLMCTLLRVRPSRQPERLRLPASRSRFCGPANSRPGSFSLSPGRNCRSKAPASRSPASQSRGVGYTPVPRQAVPGSVPRTGRRNPPHPPAGRKAETGLPCGFKAAVAAEGGAALKQHRAGSHGLRLFQAVARQLLPAAPALQSRKGAGGARGQHRDVPQHGHHIMPAACSGRIRGSGFPFPGNPPGLRAG